MPDPQAEHLHAVYAKARNKYRPRDIRVLFVAETPPCALDRFFYFEDVKKQDSLFLEIMGIIYPDLKKRYLASSRDTELKADLLARFKSDGYWLTDLYEIPTSIDMPAGAAEDLMNRLKTLIDKETPVILIKANVYDEMFKNLRSNGYNVIDERMPFPGSGQQRVFREKFARALQAAG